MLYFRKDLTFAVCAFWHVILVFVSPVHGYFDHPKEKGWFFFKQTPRKPSNKTGDSHENKTDSRGTLQSKEAVQKIKNIQQEFDEATALALVSPTPQNVQRMMRLQRQILDRASTFSDRWMEVSLWEERYNRPEDNGSALHRKVMRNVNDKDLTAHIKNLAKHMGLFFVFKSHCRYCHEYAPTIKEFAQEYGFKVEAVSADGGVLKEFPKPLLDNGALQKLNPQGYYPAVFLAHPESNRFVPLAYGITSPSELRQRLHIIIQNLEQGRFGQ